MSLEECLSLSQQMIFTWLPKSLRNKENPYLGSSEGGGVVTKKFSGHNVNRFTTSVAI